MRRWPPDLLEGKTVLVTGAAGRYGSAISLELARAGARVVLTDHDQARLEAASAPILARSPEARLACHCADQTDDDSVSRLVERCLEEFGRLDGFVTCAAQLGGQPFLETTIDRLDEMLRLNLRSVLVGSLHAARAMAATGGSMVHLGSVGGSRAHRSAVVYDACKGALEAGSRAMAVDLAPAGIRVNVVAPPAPLDRMADLSDYDEAQARVGAAGILRRDVANAVVFLVSDLAARITGQTLLVDNGLTATLRWSEGGLLEGGG